MINVQNLTKAFGQKIAVNHVTFSVERGEILGFLGPNGAGKSTTMRMVTGYIPPSEGKVTVGGYSIEDRPIEAKRLMGYLPENAPAYTDMTVHGFLSFTAELRGLSGEAKSKAVAKAVELCFLNPVLYQSIDTLSKGYLHRTCFAQAILHDPEVLIMDEPTDGLDPNQKHEVRALIRQMGTRKAIIFSTHILEEVEAVCTRAIIIDRGQIVANGTPAELKQRSDMAGSVSLRVLGVPGKQVKQKLVELPLVRKAAILQEEGAGPLLRAYPAPQASDGQLARSVFDLALQEHWKIEELHTEEGHLDEVFRGITWSETQSTAQS